MILLLLDEGAREQLGLTTVAADQFQKRPGYRRVAKDKLKDKIVSDISNSPRAEPG